MVNKTAHTTLSKNFTPEQVHELTGISTPKIRKLCELGRLGAINTSLGKRPRWLIPETSLQQFFTPKAATSPANATRGKRSRIDANVEKIL